MPPVSFTLLLVTILCKKPILFRRIDKDTFQQSIEQHEPPCINGDASTDLTNILYECSSNSKLKTSAQPYTRSGGSENRWQRIMNANESKATIGR